MVLTDTCCMDGETYCCSFCHYMSWMEKRALSLAHDEGKKKKSIAKSMVWLDLKYSLAKSKMYCSPIWAPSNADALVTTGVHESWDYSCAHVTELNFESDVRHFWTLVLIVIKTEVLLSDMDHSWNYNLVRCFTHTHKHFTFYYFVCSTTHT